MIQNLFQKLSIFKTEGSSSEIWDCQWLKTSRVTPVFTALILLLLCQLLCMHQFCGWTITNYLFFLMVTNACATSWVTFLNIRIIVFYQLFDLIFP